MTIYILSNDPAETAQMLDDKSLSKMITTIAEVLCGVHESILTKSYINEPHKWILKDLEKIPLCSKDVDEDGYTKNPWVIWGSACVANYRYLVELGIACSMEIEYRVTGFCEHMHRRVIEWAKSNVPEIPVFCASTGDKKVCSSCAHSITSSLHTEIPLVMPKTYHAYCISYKTFDDVFFISDFIEPEAIPPEAFINPIESYRAYYQSKLQAGLRRKGNYSNNRAVKKGFEYPGHPHPIIPKWTRRSMPTFLNLTLTEK